MKRYLHILLSAAALSCALYVALLLQLIDAPIQAAYWVSEMITAKHDLVKKYTDSRKIYIAGGSSTLFSVDAEDASRQLGRPVINFGLHAALGLERNLSEVGRVVESGDILILALEPKYYACGELDDWQVRNIVAWDHGEWERFGLIDKLKFLLAATNLSLFEMLNADVQRRFSPETIVGRLSSFDKALVLERFRTRPAAASFAYSAYNLNSHGDMQKNEGSRYTGPAVEIVKPAHVCASAKQYLLGYVGDIRRRGISVYFANTPYIDESINQDALMQSEAIFRKEISGIGCLIDSRRDLLFKRKYFFDTALHLNVQGKALRTGLLLDAIRKRVLSGHCESP